MVNLLCKSMITVYHFGEWHLVENVSLEKDMEYQDMMDIV